MYCVQSWSEPAFFVSEWLPCLAFFWGGEVHMSAMMLMLPMMLWDYLNVTFPPTIFNAGAPLTNVSRANTWLHSGHVPRALV